MDGTDAAQEPCPVAHVRAATADASRAAAASCAHGAADRSEHCGMPPVDSFLSPQGRAGMTEKQSDEERSLHLAEERLVVDKRTVETGRVRIRTMPFEREERVRERLASEDVTVERVPVDREVDAPPPIREEDGVLVIPVVEEFLVVEKRLRVTEELHVRRRRRVDEIDEPVTLRSTRAVVERESAGEEQAGSRTRGSQEYT